MRASRATADDRGTTNVTWDRIKLVRVYCIGPVALAMSPAASSSSSSRAASGLGQPVEECEDGVVRAGAPRGYYISLRIRRRCS
jgi:hypothetical protein